MVDFSICFIVVNSVLLYKICKEPKVHLLLKILWCISYIGWNVFPAIIMYFIYFLGIEIEVNESYYFSSYANQTFLFFSYLVAYKMIKQKEPPKFLARVDFQDSKKVLDFFLNISILLVLYKTWGILKSSVSYLEGNNIDNIQALGPIDFMSGYAIMFLVGIVFLFKKYVTIKKYNLCFILVVVYFLILTFKGGRIYIFGIVILFLYFSLQRKSKKAILMGTLVGLFALALLPALASLRGKEQINATEAIEAAKTSTGQKIVSQILLKTNSVLYGSYLLSHDGVGNQGFQMYTSTIYALIPRVIYAGKPEPGSVDGTQTGLVARRSAMYDNDGDYNGIENNGVPVSLSSLWGGGFWGFLIEIFTTAYMLFLLNSIFKTRKFLFVCFGLSLTAFPVCVMEVPFPTVSVGLQRDFVIYMTLTILLSRYSKNKFKNV